MQTRTAGGKLEPANKLERGKVASLLGARTIVLAQFLFPRGCFLVPRPLQMGGVEGGGP